MYLTNCELMSVECEIPFLKLLLAFVFFSVSCLSLKGLLVPTTQALVLFYALVMFYLVFHFKSKA